MSRHAFAAVCPARLSRLLLGVLCAGVLGAGCGGSAPASTELEPRVVTDPAEIPAYANMAGIRTRRQPVTNPIFRDDLDDLTSTDAEFQLLVRYVDELGYRYEPTATDYITATDADGSPLIGISWRRPSPDGRTSVLLVSFYRLASDRPFARAYAYGEVLHDQSTFDTTRFWAVGPELYGFRSTALSP